jgi:hypothetical protein
MISNNGLRISLRTIPTSILKNYLEFAFVRSRCGSMKKVIWKISTISFFSRGDTNLGRYDIILSDR